jgi:hypothetical protein
VKKGRALDIRWRRIFYALAAARLFACIPFIIDDDEAWWVVAARALRSPFDYYLRAVDHKPPGVVWFYWFLDKILFLGQSASDPRLMRALFSLTYIGAALVLGRLATLNDVAEGGESRRKWVASSFFLIASVMASPKLLTTTFDGLLVIFVILGYGVALLCTFPGSVIVAGALLGCGLLVKQTGVFFAIPILFAARYDARICARRRFSVREIGGFALGSMLVYFPAAASLHVAEFTYWNLTYPREVLVRARNSAFDSNNQLFMSLLHFGVALLPLLFFAARARIWKQGRGILRDFRVMWLFAAGLGTFLGKGLFLHYFLLMVPPLCLLAAEGWTSGWNGEERATSFASRFLGSSWLAAGYAFACVVVAFPFMELFWGNDLPYYEAVGRKIRQLSGPGAPDSVLIWGGTALPLTYSGALYPGRFLLPRFAEPPYDTSLTLGLFHQDLATAPPRIVVDLHERGDNRFNNPFESDPVVLALVRGNYRPYIAPGIPWAKFYLSFEPPASVGLEPIRTDEELRRTYERFPAERNGWNHFVEFYGANPHLSWVWLKDVFALDQKLRAQVSLELIARQSQNVEIRQEAIALAENVAAGATEFTKIDEFLLRVAHGVSEDIALPWRSMAWWPESAIVELQPKLFSPSSTSPSASTLATPAMGSLESAH